MKISHAGKMGDLVYALPVMKAVARTRKEKITIVTSPHCFQIVPLLWEQPYIEDVEMDYSRSYHIEEGSMVPWAVLGPGEGLNLSPQPSMYRPDAPTCWTAAYAEIAGVSLTMKDKIALPTLWNHRQWYWENIVESVGKHGIKKTWKPPKTCVLAPESQTLKCISHHLWMKVAKALQGDFQVIVIGENRKDPWPDGVIDLRGMTTVSSAARLLAEAYVVICANSLPWHLARHAGTPTFCFQDQYIERCVPIDSPYAFYTSEIWMEMVEAAFRFGEHPRTSLWSDKELKELLEAA